MGLIEIHRDGKLAVAELTTAHSRSSYGIPVLVIREGEVDGVGAGEALGQGDLAGLVLRTRDPGDVADVEEWAGAIPGISVSVAHGGPRGGPGRWKYRDPVKRQITLERFEWGEVERLSPKGSWSDRIRALLSKVNRNRNERMER